MQKTFAMKAAAAVLLGSLARRLHDHPGQTGRRRGQRVEAPVDRRQRQRDAVAPLFDGAGFA